MITLSRSPLRPTAPTDPARRSRRRFARRQWLRRWLVWRYVIASVLLVLAVIGGIWLVFVSSVLTVQQVQVQGENTLTRQQILAVAQVPEGAHLAELDLAAIRSRIGAMAQVRSVDVSRDWPHGVLIEVTERTPVAVVEIGGHFHAMDSQGVIFRTYRRPPPGLPRVVSTDGAGSAALAEAARVIAALPSELGSRVDHVAVSGVDQVSLAMRSGDQVIWGSDAQSALKARVLEQLLKQPGHTYDVSVPGQPITSPR